MQILLYGDQDFPDSLNKDILLLTLRFIHETMGSSDTIVVLSKLTKKQ